MPMACSVPAGISMNASLTAFRYFNRPSQSCCSVFSLNSAIVFALCPNWILPSSVVSRMTHASGFPRPPLYALANASSGWSCTDKSAMGSRILTRTGSSSVSQLNHSGYCLYNADSVMSIPDTSQSACPCNATTL